MANRYVYVAGAENGYLKIGVAENVHKRMAELQTGSPLPLILHASIAVQQHTARQVEDYAHWLLYEYRAAGEWFKTDVATACQAVKNASRMIKEHGTKNIRSVMLSLRVPHGLAKKVDDALKGGEGRSDFMRAAILQELIRRKK